MPCYMKHINDIDCTKLSVMCRKISKVRNNSPPSAYVRPDKHEYKSSPSVNSYHLLALIP